MTGPSKPNGITGLNFFSLGKTLLFTMTYDVKLIFQKSYNIFTIVITVILLPLKTRYPPYSDKEQVYIQQTTAHFFHNVV
jgi:hypothetical protein